MKVSEAKQTKTEEDNQSKQSCVCRIASLKLEEKNTQRESKSESEKKKKNPLKPPPVRVSHVWNSKQPNYLLASSFRSHFFFLSCSQPQFHPCPALESGSISSHPRSEQPIVIPHSTKPPCSTPRKKNPSYFFIPKKKIVSNKSITKSPVVAVEVVR